MSLHEALDILNPDSPGYTFIVECRRNTEEDIPPINCGSEIDIRNTGDTDVVFVPAQEERIRKMERSVVSR